MKFKLSTAYYFYQHKKRRKQLEELGFEFTQQREGIYLIEGAPIIEINTLDELIQFGKEYGGEEGKIIVCDGHIEIYDDYRE